MENTGKNSVTAVQFTLPKINGRNFRGYNNTRDGTSLEAVDYSYQAHGRNSNSLIQTQKTFMVREVEVGVEENV